MCRPGQFVWLGLSEPDEALLRRVQQKFHLHDLAIEDAYSAHQRPKLEQYEDSLFVVQPPNPRTPDFPAPLFRFHRLCHLPEMRRLLLVLAIAVAAVGCNDGQTPSTPGSSGNTPARLLVVTHTTGFRHDSIPAAEAALGAIGTQSGLFQAEFCRTADHVRTRLTPAGLAAVDAVFFANTTGDLGIPDMGAFLAWIGGGKAFLGAHSASDTYHDSPEYLEMLGGEFLTHGAIVEAEVRVNDPNHPAVAHLAPRFRMTDEWYRFRPTGPGRTVLLSFDRNPPDGVGVAGDPTDLPLAWHKPYGSGRVFYTALGHRSEVWADPRFRTHLLEAIRRSLGT
ncbi:MAG: ThuA domain-containing protein [Vicinamibacterales bacterium]